MFIDPLEKWGEVRKLKKIRRAKTEKISKGVIKKIFLINSLKKITLVSFIFQKVYLLIFHQMQQRKIKTMEMECINWEKELAENLEYLDVSFCDLDDSFLFELAHAKVANRLKTLKIRSTRIGEGVKVFLYKFKNLECLDLRGLEYDIELKSTISFLPNYERLKTLKIDQKVQDWVLLSQKFPNLVNLTCIEVKEDIGLCPPTFIQSFKSIKTSSASRGSNFFNLLPIVPHIHKIRFNSHSPNFHNDHVCFLLFF